MERSSMPNRLGGWLIGSLALLLCANGRSEALVIDDFSTGPFTIVGTNTTVDQTQSGLDPAHVVGGSRFISFRSFAVPPSALTLDDQAGTLHMSPGNCCSYLSLRYGSAGNPLQLDLTADGSDRFLVTFADISEQIPSSVPSIVVRDHQNRMVPIIGGGTLPNPPVGRFSVAVPFTQFSNFDLTNIQSIEIAVSRYSGGRTFTLDSIATVPEPSSVVSLLISVAVSYGLLIRPSAKSALRADGRPFH
jgi:hypothetical protein